MTLIVIDTFDTTAFNRMFLLMAREAARLQAGELITGLPREVLQEVSRMSLDDIERVARACKPCIVSLRLDADQLRAIARMREEAATAYSLTAVVQERSS